MSTLNEAALAMCAHLRVQWTETRHPGGETSGRWLCDSCGGELVPRVLVGDRFKALEADLATAVNVSAKLCTENVRLTARLATAEARMAEFKDIGQQFERDAQQHFEQGCLNLQWAERAEARVKELETELAAETALCEATEEEMVRLAAAADARVKELEAQLPTAEQMVVLRADYERLVASLPATLQMVPRDEKP